VDFDELYEPMETMVTKVTRPFSNAGESVFSAVQDQPVDFLGKSPRCGHPEFDLSPVVIANGGLFDTRDELLAKLERKPGFFGRLLFDLLYDGKPIRRVAE